MEKKKFKYKRVNAQGYIEGIRTRIHGRCLDSKVRSLSTKPRYQPTRGKGLYKYLMN